MTATLSLAVRRNAATPNAADVTLFIRSLKRLTADLMARHHDFRAWLRAQPDKSAVEDEISEYIRNLTAEIDQTLNHAAEVSALGANTRDRIGTAFRTAEVAASVEQLRELRAGLDRGVASDEEPEAVFDFPERPLDLIHRGTGDPSRAEHLGPYQIETLLTAAEEGAVTAYRVRVEPHSTTNVSYHRIAEEIYFVLSGSGIAVLNGREYPLKPGDFLRLPPGTTHGFITAAEPLEMLDTHTPGCRPDRDVYFVGEVPPGFTVPPGEPGK